MVIIAATIRTSLANHMLPNELPSGTETPERDNTTDTVAGGNVDNWYDGRYRWYNDQPICSCYRVLSVEVVRAWVPRLFGCKMLKLTVMKLCTGWPAYIQGGKQVHPCGLAGPGRPWARRLNASNFGN